MSGTRSHFRPEPATSTRDVALLIVAHGDTGGENGNVLAQELARRIERSGRFSEVGLAYIRGQPSIEDAVARIRSDRLRLFPLFMSDGYYVREAIPRRLGLNNGVDAFGHAVSIDEPFGTNPLLPPLLLSATAGAALENAISPSSATLLLVAHGSQKSSHSREAAERTRTQIAAAGTFSTVALSFIEEEPAFAAALRSAARPTIVLGLLAGEGMHASEDIRDAVVALANREVVLVERLGGYAPIVELIAAGLK